VRRVLAILILGVVVCGGSATSACAVEVGASESAPPTTSRAVPLEHRRRGRAPTPWLRCQYRGPQRDADAPGCVERVRRVEWTRVAAKEAGGGGSGEGGGADNLAMQLQNPLAALISVPIQANLDEGFGPGDTGYRWTINVQPVFPFKLSSRWNLISRTVMPLIIREGLLPGEDDLIGLGDFVQTFGSSAEFVGDLTGPPANTPGIRRDNCRRPSRLTPGPGGEG